MIGRAARAGTGAACAPNMRPAHDMVVGFLALVGLPPIETRERAVIICNGASIYVVSTEHAITRLRAEGGEEAIIAALRAPLPHGRMRVVLADREGNWETAHLMLTNAPGAGGVS